MGEDSHRGPENDQSQKSQNENDIIELTDISPAPVPDHEEIIDLKIETEAASDEPQGVLDLTEPIQPLDTKETEAAEQEPAEKPAPAQPAPAIEISETVDTASLFRTETVALPTGAPPPPKVEKPIEITDDLGAPLFEKKDKPTKAKDIPPSETKPSPIAEDRIESSLFDDDSAEGALLFEEEIQRTEPIETAPEPETKISRKPKGIFDSPLFDDDASFEIDDKELDEWDEIGEEDFDLGDDPLEGEDDLDLTLEETDVDLDFEDELVESMGVEMDSKFPETLTSEISEPEPAAVTPAQIERIVRQTIEKIFAEKIENMVIEITEKAITKEIEKLRQIILGEAQDRD